MPIEKFITPIYGESLGKPRHPSFSAIRRGNKKRANAIAVRASNAPFRQAHLRKA